MKLTTFDPNEVAKYLDAPEFKAALLAEAMTVVNVALDMLERHVEENEAIERHPELKAEAQAIGAALAELYQNIGKATD